MDQRIYHHLRRIVLNEYNRTKRIGAIPDSSESPLSTPVLPTPGALFLARRLAHLLFHRILMKASSPRS